MEDMAKWSCAGQNDTIAVEASAELDREYMYEKGEALGLGKEALALFRHFNFVNVTLTVNKKTGEVLDWKKSDLDASRAV